MKTIEIQKGSHIEFMSRELLFLSKSNQPYRGVVYISFKSKGKSFNLKDLKKYITSLRDKTFYSEDIAYEIYQQINNSIKSKKLGVIVDITSRGGIAQRIRFGKKFKPTKKDNIFQI